jgi:hypothetical protein
MFRCVVSRLLPAAALLCATALQAQSFGETERKFPATALRGTMVFGASTQATLNGQAVQLAPGARIFDPENRLLLTGDANGTKAVVHYTTDLYQQPLTVWILTEAERRKQPWPKTLAEAQAWRFDFLKQTWSQP